MLFRSHGVATQGASRALDGINSEIRATAQGVAALHPKLTAAVQGWQGLGASAGQANKLKYFLFILQVFKIYL